MGRRLKEDSDNGQKLKAEVLRTLRAAPWSVQAIATAYGVHHNTVTRWAKQAGVRLPPGRERMAMGGLEGTRRLWGDWEKRRELAHAMRAKGATLREIAAEAGYKNQSGAHYATKTEK